MQTVYLTRRNLLALLSKLDRVKAGGESACRLGKHDTTHPTYPCTDDINVIAVEDEAYYTDRTAGGIHPSEELFVAKEKAREAIIDKVAGLIEEIPTDLRLLLAEYNLLRTQG